MPDVMAVTSFSQAGWETYAETGLKSFCDNFPGDIAVYYEDEAPEFKHRKIIYRPLYEVEGLREVLAWAKESPVLQGRMPGGEYCYNFDLYKFCRKVFAQVHAALTFNGILYWLDADAQLVRKVSKKQLVDMLEGTYTAAPFRKGWNIESGLVCWDTRHEKNEDFMKAYRGLFTGGTILQLQGFHDCWAYQAALKMSGAPWRDLSPGAQRIEDVMLRTPLAGYLHHDKGIRKYVKEDAA